MSTRADTEAPALVRRRASDHIGQVDLRDGFGNDGGFVILVFVAFRVVADGRNGGRGGSIFLAIRKDVVDNLVHEAKDHFFVGGHGGGLAGMMAGI